MPRRDQLRLGSSEGERLWRRGTVATIRARREGRLVHRHNWRRLERAFEFEFRCEICPKVLTEMSLVRAGSQESIVELFQPMREEQFREWLEEGKYARALMRSPMRYL